SKTVYHRPDVAAVQFIDSAKGTNCSVVVADYDFNLPDVADALVRAKARCPDQPGQDPAVRLLTDGDTVEKACANTPPPPTKPQCPDDLNKDFDDLNATVCANYQKSGRKPADPSYITPFAKLGRAKVAIRHDGKRGSIMHNKYIVVNNVRVWTGGWNMSGD